MTERIYLPQVRASKTARENAIIRVAPDVFDALNELAYKTAMTKMELTTLLLRDALSRVELVERKLYEIRMQSGAMDID